MVRGKEAKEKWSGTVQEGGSNKENLEMTRSGKKNRDAQRKNVNADPPRLNIGAFEDDEDRDEVEKDGLGTDEESSDQESEEELNSEDGASMSVLLSVLRAKIPDFTSAAIEMEDFWAQLDRVDTSAGVNCFSLAKDMKNKKVKWKDVALALSAFVTKMCLEVQVLKNEVCGLKKGNKQLARAGAEFNADTKQFSEEWWKVRCLMKRENVDEK